MNLQEWQKAKVGDNARVISLNKSGVIIQIYGRKFHLLFADETENTFDKNELELIKED